MKKLSLIAALTLSTMLSACGGGGGGHSFLPPTIPGTPNTVAPSDVTSMSATDELNIVPAVEYAESKATTRSRMNAKRKAVRSAGDNAEAILNDKARQENAQQLYALMKDILIDNNLDKSDDDLRLAISLSGYDVSKISGGNLKTFIANNWNELSLKAQRVYDMYGGDFKPIALDNAIINSANISEKQDSYISFKLDKAGNIEKLNFDIDVDSSDARRAEFSAGKGGKFEATMASYVYGIRLPYEDGDAKKYIDVYIEDMNTLDYTKNNWGDLLEKLVNNIDERLYEHNETLDDETKNKLIARIQGLKFENFMRCKDNECVEDNSNIDKPYFAGQDNAEFTVTYESYGKKSGLKYSDFGYTKHNGYEGVRPVNDLSVFAGGMDAKRIDKNDLIKLQQPITFGGKAVATVLNQEDRENEKRATYDGTAELEFNNGAETLETKFDNWYNVTVTSNANQDNYNISFSNGGKMSAEDAKYFKFRDVTQNGQPVMDSFTVNNFVGTYDEPVSGQKNNMHYGAVDFGYYGDTKTDPTEATGYVVYGNDTDNIHAQIGFGTQRTKN